MTKKSKPTRDAVEILRRRFYAGRPNRLKKLEEARANEEIALAQRQVSLNLSLPSSSVPLHRSSAALKTPITKAIRWQCCEGSAAR